MAFRAEDGRQKRLISRITEGIKRYFGDDNEYIYEAKVGQGAFGRAYLIKRVAPGTANYERLVIKILGPQDMPWSSGENQELQAMLRFRGAAHIVQCVAGADDPLTFEFSRSWIVMEWLENGSLEDFVDRVLDAGKPVPNRVLWSLFLCLIRSCIALAWPDTYQGLVEQLETCQSKLPGYAVHNKDMHIGNYVFARFGPQSNGDEEEHRAVPKLKMIDLGILALKSNPTEAEWTENNDSHIRQVSETMDALAALGRDPEDPTLDPQIKEIIKLCMGRTAPPPKLNDLQLWLEHALDVKSAAHYQLYMGGVAEVRDEAIRAEKDDAVMDFVRSLILDAATIGADIQ